MLQSSIIRTVPDFIPTAGGGNKEAPASKRQVRRFRGKDMYESEVTNNVFFFLYRWVANTHERRKRASAAVPPLHPNGVEDPEVRLSWFCVRHVD